MKQFFFRLYDDYICYTICRNKKIFFWLIICFILGFILGLLLGNNEYSLTVLGGSLEYSVKLFSGEVSFFTVIFRGIFINLRYFVIVWIFSLCVYLLPLNFLFIAFKGYLSGCAIILFSNLLGVHGFASAFIIVLPCQFILIFSLMLYTAAAAPQTISYKKSFVCWRQHLKTCAVYFCLSLCNIIVELTLIYVIIKPFNILI